MLDLTWVMSNIRRRGGRFLLTVGGVALAVALLGSVGAFLARSKSTMTARAIDRVAIDWQVEASLGSNPDMVANQVAGSSSVTSSESVGFASVPGLTTSNGTTTQTTGAGVVLGISDTYRRTFPSAIRQLTGNEAGVLLAQQTAANLRASVGETISIARAGLEPIVVRVDGIVDLPQADSLFQTVGAPIGSQPQAPPDNVLLLPSAQWHSAFDAVASTRPDFVRTQIHARLDHRLPSDPAAGFDQVSGAARNLEVTLAGSALVGNNLGATLDAARADALYSQVLFLFLGLPGVVLAFLLTATVADASAERRRRDQALLRTRGATRRTLVRLGLAEALSVGIVGSLVGLAIAATIGRVAFGTFGFGAGVAGAMWMVSAALVGLSIAGITVGGRAWRDARAITVAASRLGPARSPAPWWYRAGVDLILLAVGGFVFWLTSRSGYKLVLAVEGLPKLSVSYWAFAGPSLIWVGLSLLTWRLTYVLVNRGRPLVAAMARPLAGGLADTVAASLQRQRRLLARGAALVAATLAFAASTAVFNSTYRQQADIDALLSNGADVTVTQSPGVVVPAMAASVIAAVPGVRRVEAIQHRFAYVGADLQDLYGVNPTTIVSSTKLQDAYFVGGTAKELMSRLASQPDSILVSEETVKDFQLHPGDHLTLRLQNGQTKQYREVPFTYVGIAREFPTAPHDSFLLANADYIAQATGTDAVGAFLVDTGGNNIAGVARDLRTTLGDTAQITDILTSRTIIGSTLTAVDLAGLTKVELGFALILAGASSGLVLWLGLAERHRTWAITTALGATSRQLGAFVWVEGGLVAGCGLVAGALGGWAVALTLVKVLTGVFDPAPSALAVPWAYLGAVSIIALGATAIAAAVVIRSARRPAPELLRSL